jgi:MSHA biogenesis protein MshP
MKQLQRIEQGFAAISAIFLLVVLAALGAFMLTLSNTQQLTSAQDVQGSRAYWAARSGIEWAVAAIAATPTLCPGATPSLVSGPALIEGFTIQIRCARNTYAEGADSRTIYALESQASLGATAGSTGYIERSLSAWIEK